MDKLRFRQIHLDFHTSEAIPDIGKDWDAAHFQEMLRLGNVNSINIFAKCHHGWCYFPSQSRESSIHPRLNFDLLGSMIEACHAIDIKCPVYISAGLDEQIAQTHSGWLRRGADGLPAWSGWMKPGFHELCLRSPYLDILIEQTEEVVRNYDLDGVWLDIVGVRDCACDACIAEMRRRGQDPRNDDARRALGRETYLNYATRINSAIHAIKPELLVFHNSGHITRGDRKLVDIVTHFELESLPTGGWGYDHFPLSARYAQNLQGKETIGMTGKFHTSWGEFGGYKHPNALRYEAALNLANGAKVCVGDQMHPYGKLDEATYRLIGTAYAEVAQKEPWCDNVTSIADVAILSLEAVALGDGTVDAAGSDEGAVRILQQSHILYDVIDGDAEFSKYKAIVLPDAVPVSGPLLTKLAKYLKAGGKIVASGTSALDTESGAFALDFGVRSNGETSFSPEYIVPRYELRDWSKAAFVLYGMMQDLELAGGTVIADRQDPFFNRDYLHFTSHQHAPSTQVNAGPAIVQTANTLYFGFPAFKQYFNKGQAVLREIVAEPLRRLLGKPTLSTNLPTVGIQTAMRQEANHRTVVHLLYGSPVKRSPEIEVIEDIVTIPDVYVSLRLPVKPGRVTLEPQGIVRPFTYQGGVARVTVPALECHQMVVFEDAG